MPIFHHFNLNDNIIILLASSSSILSKMVKAFARSETAFFASTAGGVFMYVSSAPIRAQMTRCVSVEELGKVHSIAFSYKRKHMYHQNHVSWKFIIISMP